MNKCVLLDRDGTLIDFIHYLSDPNLVKLNSGVVSGLKMLRRHGFLLGVISNQSIIGRGLASIDQVNLVNLKLEELLASENIELDFLYICPHAPSKSCICRKPNVGLGIRAIKEYSIDINSSYMIGDQSTDIEFGQNLGVKTVQIGESRTSNSTPDKYASDMLDAARWIVKGNF